GGMSTLLAWLDKLPWWLVIGGCLTLGLLPYIPEPHIWEKLRLLATGTLTRPIDIFDLIYHALPWLLVVAKLARRLWP
ncbi:MAG TPA: hypothetical protein PK264_07590, partial [Hyphomicrobiaceae bacterium]|nr:hypothetical protein [Hyphomicrobiaceae bacterium]